MDPVPSDAELIDRALALEAALAQLLPSDDFPANAVESLTDVLVEIVAELRGQREPHITLFRPDSLVGYTRNNYEGTLVTREGRDMYDFVRTLAYRAEALDLPHIVAVNED